MYTADCEQLSILLHCVGAAIDSDMYIGRVPWLGGYNEYNALGAGVGNATWGSDRFSMSYFLFFFPSFFLMY